MNRTKSFDHLLDLTIMNNQTIILMKKGPNNSNNNNIMIMNVCKWFEYIDIPTTVSKKTYEIVNTYEELFYLSFYHTPQV